MISGGTPLVGLPQRPACQSDGDGELSLLHKVMSAQLDRRCHLPQMRLVVGETVHMSHKNAERRSERHMIYGASRVCGKGSRERDSQPATTNYR